MSSTTRDPSTLFFQTDRVKRSILAAYWAVIILAIPLWWHTTSIERLSLPTTRVASHAQTPLRIPIRLAVDAGPSVVQELRDALGARVRGASERWEALDVYIDDIRHAGSEAETYTITSTSSVPAVKNRELAYPRQASTPFELVDTLTALLAPFESTSKPDNRIFRYSPRYRLSFSLLHEDAAAGQFFEGWEVTNVISRHISPILSQLSPLHNFTIESQVQFHARLAFSPRLLDHAYGISPEDLSVFINSAEWTLSSSASNDPVIHFVLFIPSATRRPLHILDNEGSISPSSSFLLPQWGGIVISNPPSSTPPTTLSSSSLDPIFSVFAQHLLVLLGVPNLPSNVAKTLEAPKVLSEWQLDALLRFRTLSNAQLSKNTLQSIVKLVDQIDNMPVGQDVRGDVQGALAALDQMNEAAGKSLLQTLQYSARAFTLSSQAFFNPGMLALLYFPAEHKYAVYTPLFASAVIPLIVAVLRDIKVSRRGRMETQTQNQAIEGQ